MAPPPHPGGRSSSLSGENQQQQEEGHDEISFEEFFQGWLIRQQDYLNELLNARANSKDRTEDELKTLISQVLSHYQQYYEAKSIASHRDVFILFSPPWFSYYERTFLWIAGFKPGLALRIVNNSVKDLSNEQVLKIERITAETRAAERELTKEMASVQERVAGPSLVDLARRGGRLVDGETLDMDSEFQSMKETMEALVVGADFLRAMTTRKIVEMLNPIQAINFLAAATQLQVRIRIIGVGNNNHR